jgi:hypothetical protein
VSTDGQVEVVIHPADTDRRARLLGPDGELDAPDLPVSVRLLGVDVTGARGAGGPLRDGPDLREVGR